MKKQFQAETMVRHTNSQSLFRHAVQGRQIFHRYIFTRQNQCQRSGPVFCDEIDRFVVEFHIFFGCRQVKEHDAQGFLLITTFDLENLLDRLLVRRITGKSIASFSWQHNDLPSFESIHNLRESIVSEYFENLHVKELMLP
ncbi:MAG: hypothetical protein PHU71_00315 [Candidatus Gracilibacteria bacterium]|nr:hypothetical protein [Candidatus Gracilibacteria bacterium]